MAAPDESRERLANLPELFDRSTIPEGAAESAGPVATALILKLLPYSTGLVGRFRARFAASLFTCTESDELPEFLKWFEPSNTAWMVCVPAVSPGRFTEKLPFEATVVVAACFPSIRILMVLAAVEMPVELDSLPES